ncbi:AAA family ATPase [Rhizobiaceae bacterium n13]|uniref:AAA family ATPase n=1 Tax=Ferirhizobium litorale TaxID=2927786 RepID=A0AAE3U288_9HYPH|nr:AAA family ATPase [Fererhizobium litorale]MDI7860971.1 AAA family ATPase [Fererhizobium litorale]MDI7921118.1 AAA family ATPase [Fererhizobium litorale]
MRFATLDLVRYGALTDTVLRFRPDAQLHVIYGPNEAGKSSALSAFSDLLFGFPRTTSHFSFAHDAASLRVGAEVFSRAGDKLSFRRRRGAKNTLLAADDKEAALAEDALATFLGSLNRDVFERAFGLDSARLREGAAAMLQSGGEIGSLLFSAASGLMGLTNLRQKLESEADGIFAQRKSQDRLFYQAVERHEKAKRSEKENELKAGDWKRLTNEATDLDRQLLSLQEERRSTRHALDRLKLLKRLEPLIGEIDGDMTALADYADLAALPVGFVAALEQKLGARRHADDLLRQVLAEADRVKDGMDLIHVDARAVDAAREIVALYAETGGYRKTRQDLPRVDNELAGYEATLEQFAHRLGFATTADLVDRRPTDPDLVQLRALAEEGQMLIREHAALELRVEEERRLLAQFDEEGGASILIDPKPYIEQMEALSVDLAAMAKRDSIDIQVARAEANLGEATARLQPWVADLDAVLASPLPDIASIALHRETIDAQRAVCGKAQERVGDLLRQLRDLEQILETEVAAGPIVSRTEIEEARRSRDRLLQTLVGKSVEGEPAHLQESSAALAGFVLRADQLADMALADADRVARHAANRLQQDRLKREAAAAAEQRDENQRKLDGMMAEFAELFAPCGVSTLAPAEMIEWRRAIAALANERDALRDLYDQLAGIRLAEGRSTPVLRQLGEACGYAGAALLPISALADGMRRHLSMLNARWSDSRAREGERAGTKARLDRSLERLAALDVEREEWKRRFSAAAAHIGLASDATAEMVLSALKIWGELPAILVERESRARRVNGMRRDIATFEDKASVLAERLVPSLLTLPADVMAEALHEHAIKAQRAAERSQELAEELKGIQSQVARLNDEIAAVDLVLSELRAELPEGADLSGTLHRLGERARLVERLAESRNRFLMHAEGMTEEVVRSALGDFDRIAADLEIDRLSSEDQRQVELFGELTARIAENRRQRGAIETGTSAELAVFERLAADAEAKDLARQWVVLKLAASMLSSSMETYRERQADPVLMRASEHFSRLTGGRFARLVQEYGDGDELQLLAERQGGERVPLGGLSEGTGDQLYLALRLAFIEDYCSRNEPAPLILDDIFQTFDDERTACGIKALSGLGGTFQTILFTHERSVIEIARQELGDRLGLIEL